MYVYTLQKLSVCAYSVCIWYMDWHGVCIHRIYNNNTVYTHAQAIHAYTLHMFSIHGVCVCMSSVSSRGVPVQCVSCGACMSGAGESRASRGSAGAKAGRGCLGRELREEEAPGGSPSGTAPPSFPLKPFTLLLLLESDLVRPRQVFARPPRISSSHLSEKRYSLTSWKQPGKRELVGAPFNSERFLLVDAPVGQPRLGSGPALSNADRRPSPFWLASAQVQRQREVGRL